MPVIAALRHECPKVLPLFLPILISQYASIANGVIDTAMAGALGTVELASIALGVALWVPMLVFMLGVLYGVLIAVSQYCGAKDYTSIRTVTQQGAYLGIIIGLLATFILYIVSLNITIFGVDDTVSFIAKDYIQNVMWAFPIACIMYTLRFYCEGQGAVIPITIIALISVAFKIFGNYVFMFGNLGMPQMGVAGCGIATILEYTGFALMIIAYISFAKRFASVRLFASVKLPNFCSILEIAQKGIPIGICLTSEFLVFSVLTIFISQEGAVPIAAHQVAFNCMVLFFSMAAAFSNASCIRVGHVFGGGNKEALRQTAIGIITLSFLIGCVLMVGMILGAPTLAAVFSEDYAVVSLAISILFVAAFFQIADAMLVCLSGILRGIGDVTIPFVYITISYWLIGIPLGYVLSGMPLPFGIVLSSNSGVVGWWLALTVALTLACVALGRRTYVMFWKQNISIILPHG